MFRRRKKGAHQTQPRAVQPDAAEAEAFNRRSTTAEGLEESGKTPRPDGPWDASEVELDQARDERVDLGALLIPRVQNMRLQIQLDKRTNKATSVLLQIEKAAVQLIAIAAPRSSGMWEQTRLQIAEDAKKRGGKADEANGPFGIEVRAVVPVTTQDGKQARQASRVSGIDGPRWMLRGTFVGTATTDAEAFQQLVDVVRGIVVIRGDSPMPPGDVMTLQPPADGSVTSESAPS